MPPPTPASLHGNIESPTTIRNMVVHRTVGQGEELVLPTVVQGEALLSPLLLHALRVPLSPASIHSLIMCVRDSLHINDARRNVGRQAYEIHVQEARNHSDSQRAAEVTLSRFQKTKALLHPRHALDDHHPKTSLLGRYEDGTASQLKINLRNKRTTEGKCMDGWAGGWMAR